jgi:hypothetical protein
MKSGTLPKSAKQAADELIAGTDKDPAKLGELPDEDPDDEVLAGEASADGAGEPALAEA